METEEKKKSPTKALKGLLPLLLALVLMMAIAKVFVTLVGGEKDPASPLSNAFYFERQKEALAYTFTPFSAEEEALLRRELALTPAEEARFRYEFDVFANQYLQASVAHRLWVEQVSESGAEIADRGQFLELYLAENKKHTYLTEHYAPIFSDILSPERASRVFLLHERIRRTRGEEKR